MVVTAILFSVEIFFRLNEELMFSDVKSIRHAVAAAEKFSSDSNHDILFLGNSVVDDGIDLHQFELQLGINGIDSFNTSKFSTDGTRVLEWYLTFKRYFVYEEKRMDIVVVGFVFRHLEERLSLDPLHLGRYYCAGDDILELFDEYLVDPQDQMRFMLARYSSFFSNYDQVQMRILDSCIPSYRWGVGRIQSLLDSGSSSIIHDDKRDYRTLKKLIDCFIEQDILGIFVAMPTRDMWDIDSEQVKIIEDSGMKFIDFRHISMIDYEHYMDFLHLNKDGAAIFTRLLAEHYVDVAGKSGYDTRKR